jgi:hypothetical protein
MYTTKNKTYNLEEVPPEWVFSKYLGINEPLDGRTVFVRSIINPKDSTPSLAVYYKNGVYKFKDFSSGKGGNHVELIKLMYNCSTVKAIDTILNDFNNSEKLKIYEKTQNVEYTVECTEYEIGKYKKFDYDLWGKSNISLDLLEKFNVYPLNRVVIEFRNSYCMYSHLGIYGMFTANGDLAKIYRPNAKENKHLNILPYNPGFDQIDPDIPYVGIVSSLKDGLSLLSLDIKTNILASTSETTILTENVISSLSKYKKYCLLDFDTPGIRSMLKYKELYKIPPVFVKKTSRYKDVAEYVEFDKNLAKLDLVVKINKVIC